MLHEVLPHSPVSVPEHITVTENEAVAASDNDRLIRALQSCFSDLLRKQDEIQRAVEALKPQMPAPDKKIAFWTSYMKLADEHDTEFKEKYSTDLDMSLIFAGLFSAITSAFIIQIQPQLIPDPPTNPPIKIVVAQSLLYISLFTTLLAALLAVLGKQWIMYYQAAGSKGTTEERGLERQRKLDGLRKWKLEAVLEMFPLLLQLALLLFSTALSVYLWTINVSIAIIVLAFTFLGFGTYLFLLSSAIFSRDSPFQTSCATCGKRIISLTLRVLKPAIYIWRKFIQNVKSFMSLFRDSQGYLLPCSSGNTSVKSHNEPQQERFPEWLFKKESVEVPAVLWVLETSTDPIMISTAAEMALDLQWPLGLDLRLSMTRLEETAKHWSRSEQTIQQGMIHPASSCGMAYCSLRLVARASGHRRRWKDWWSSPEGLTPDLKNVFWIYNDRPEVIIGSATPQVTKWALNTIPSLDFTVNFGGSFQKNLEHFVVQFAQENIPKLDEEDVCNYLCCLNSFFRPVDPKILNQRNKRYFKVFLMTQLFEGLQSATIDATLVTRLFQTTSGLLNMGVSESRFYSARQVRYLIKEISNFCSALPQEEGWFDLVISAATFARARNTGFNYEGQRLDDVKLPGVQWIYAALELVWVDKCASRLEEWDAATYTVVDGILALLAWNRRATLSHTPSEEALKIITRALSNGGNLAQSAFFILTEARHWFLDPQLKPILQNSDVWTQLGFVASENPRLSNNFASQYFELGQYIATMPEWKQILYNTLSTWITVFNSLIIWSEDLSTKCSSVFRIIWALNVPDQYQFLDRYEESWALAITALTKAWEAFKFSDSFAVRDFVLLIQGTVSVALRERYSVRAVATSGDWKEIPSNLRHNFSPQLAKSLIQAAQNASQTMSDNRHKVPISSAVNSNEVVLNQVAGLLHSLGQEIDTRFEAGSGEIQLGGLTRRYENWDDLADLFREEIVSIQPSLT